MIVNENETVTLSGVITGKLEVNDDAKIIVDGPLWVLGEAILKGHDVTPGTDGGSLVTEGKLTVGGHGGFKSDPGLNNNLKLVSLVGGEDEVAIDFSSGETKMKAAFYAPNGKVNVSGGLILWGSLIAKKVYLSGFMTIIQNTEYDAGLGEPTTLEMLNWFEN